MAAVTTVKAGDWFDPSVWSTGGVPGVGDRAIIQHAVTVAAAAAVGEGQGVVAGGGTVATSGNSTTLTGTGSSFTAQVRVGDLVAVGSVVRTVTAVASDSSLTMGVGATVAAGSSYTITPAAVLLSGSSARLVVNAPLTLHGALVLDVGNPSKTDVVTINADAVNTGGIEVDVPADQRMPLAFSSRSGQYSRVKINGTDPDSGGRRASFRAKSGGGTIYWTSQIQGGSLNAAYCDFSGWWDGSAATSSNCSINVQLGNGGGLELTLDHCDFDETCGRVGSVSSPNAVSIVSLRSCGFRNTKNNYSFSISSTVGATAVREILDCVFVNPVNLISVARFDVRRNRFMAAYVVANGPADNWSDNLVIERPTSGGSSVSVHQSTSNDYHVQDPRTNAPNWHCLSLAKAVDQSHTGMVFDSTYPDNVGDLVIATGGDYTITLTNNLLLPASDGRPPGQLCNGLNTPTPRHTINHNTVVSMDRGEIGVAHAGETYVPLVGWVREFYDNIFWAPPGYQAIAYQRSTINLVGDPIASTDGVLNCGRNVSNNPLTAPTSIWTDIWGPIGGYADSPGNLQLWASGGTSSTGTVTFNVATFDGSASTTITVEANVTASAMLTAIVNALTSLGETEITTQKVVSGIALNAPSPSTGIRLDLRKGSTRYPLGRITVASHTLSAGEAYASQPMFSNTNGLGAGDFVADPNFVDTTRNFATFYLDYLGRSCPAGDWSASGSYTAGDIVRDSDPGFYGGKPIAWRCLQDHAGGTPDSKPGSGSSYRSYWELATHQAFIDDAGKDHDPAVARAHPTDLLKWVRAGWSPTNPALRGAGHDGATVGAIEGVYATALSLSGPSSGPVGQATTFTVAPNGGYNGTVTPSDGGAGGVFNPPVLVWTGDATSKTFTYEPSTSAPRTLSITDSWGLPAPAGLPFAPVASAFTMAGPGSGRIGQPSADFTVTPNGPYTGTITPSDGGAGGTFSPAVLTWNNDDAAATFTYTPSGPGPRTITASASGPLNLPPSLPFTATASVFTFTGPAEGHVSWVSPPFTVAPNGPYSGTVTPGDGGAGGTFSPAVLSWNNDDTSQSFTYTPAQVGTLAITAANDGGLPAPAPLSLVVQVSEFTVSGPVAGQAGATSAPFTVTLTEPFTGSITFDDGGAGGAFSPSVLNWTGDATPRSFTYTPATTGTKWLALHNDGSYVDPPPLAYLVTASSYAVAGPTSGRQGVASAPLTVTPNGPYTGTITPSDGGAGGTFSPAVLSWTGDAAPQSFTYTPAAGGAVTLSFTNDGGLTDPAPHWYTATAQSYSVAGPLPSASACLAASDFTITPDGPHTGTITPSDGGAGGTFSPPALVWTGDASARSFTYTPATIGPKTITLHDDGGLVDPEPLSYIVENYTYTVDGPAAGVVGVAAGPFVVTPARAMTGTVTPSDGGAGGTFAPAVLVWTGDASARSFTYTPAAVGPMTITTGNTAGFLDPASRSLAVRATGTFVTTYRATTWSDPYSWHSDPGPIPDDWTGVNPPPGEGDMVQIDWPITLDTPVTVGTGAADSTALTISAGLTITDGGILTLRGNVLQRKRVTVTGQGAGVIRFDASQTTPAGAAFTWQINDSYIGNAAARPLLAIRGRADARFRVESVPGGAAGCFTNGGWSQSGHVDAEYCDFIRIGDGTRDAFQPRVESGGILRLDHCTLKQCGRVAMDQGLNKTATLLLNASTWTEPAATMLVAVPSVGSDRTTGVWQVTNCDFAGPVQLRSRTFTISGNTYRDAWRIDNTAQPADTGPLAPSSLGLTGPAAGAVGASSSTFTLSLLPAGSQAIGLTVTPTDGGAGGTFSPASVVITDTSTSVGFTYVPASPGPRWIGVTTDGTVPGGNGVLRADPVPFVATVPATSYVLAPPDPAAGLGGVASAPFHVALPPSRTVSQEVRITPNDNAGGGVFVPASVVLDSSNPSASFTYLPTAAIGPRTIHATNDGGLADPPAAVFSVTDPAVTYTLTGPATGEVERASDAFVVALGAGSLGRTVRVTPAASNGDNQFLPAYVELNDRQRVATFQHVPGQWSTRTVTVTNDGGLTDPPGIAYLAKVQTGRSGLDPAGNRGPDMGGYDLFSISPWWRELGRDISNDPVDPNSATYIGRLAGMMLHVDGSTTTANGGNSLYGMPYNVVKGDTPRVPLTNTLYPKDSDPGPVPWPPDITLESWISPTHTPAPMDRPGVDQHAMVYCRDEASGGMAELWESLAAYSEDGGASWKAHGGARFDLLTGALRPADWTSGDAAGLPIAPLVARFDEVARGAVNHPIRVTFGGWRGGFPMLRNKYVWPARHTSYAGSALDGLPFGARMRLTQAWYDANKDQFTGVPRILVETMRRYGLIVADVGGNFYINTTQDERWTVSGPESLLRLQSIPASAFEVLELRSEVALTGPATGLAGSPAAFQITYQNPDDDNFRCNAYFYWTTDVDLPDSSRTWRSTGLSAAKVTLDPSQRSGTIQFTPPAPGAYLVKIGSGAEWLPPPPLPFLATAADGAIPMLQVVPPTPVRGTVNRASEPFTVTLPAGVMLGRPIAVIPSDGGAGGRFEPETLTLDDTARTANFVYTPATTGTKQIAVSTGAGLDVPPAALFVAEPGRARARRWIPSARSLTPGAPRRSGLR